MNIKAKTGLVIVSSMMLLNGCALLNPQPAPTIKYIQVPNDSSMLELNRVAKKSQRSAQVMAEIQNAQAQSSITMLGAKNATIAATSIPRGWGQRTNMSFQGPFDKLIIKLAEKARYQYFTEGNRPANVPLVNISAESKTLKQILDEVVAQLPANISIVLHPRTHTILVIYNQTGV